jgi:hypothetical protein
MKQRNVMAVIFLSIITLGIYDLFWLVSVKKELNAKTNVHTPTLWLLVAPYLLWAIGSAVAIGVSQGAPDSAASSAASIITIVVYLVGALAIVPITFYWFFKFSKAVHQYTKGEINTAMAFILLWLLRFIGIAVIQDSFNDILLAGTQPAGEVPAYPAAPSDGSAAPQPPQPPTPPTPPQDPTPPANPIG